MFLPENIDLGQSEKYVLSIRIKPDGFMFSIYEPGNEMNYCLRDTTFSGGDDLSNNVQRIIFELGFLTQEFKRTNVVIVSKDYELIPAAYFDTKNKKDLYDFTHFNKSGYLLSGLIDKQDVVTLFNLDRNIFDFLSRNLWTPQFYHHSNLIAGLFEDKGKITSTNSKMYLNFHGNFMDVICFSGSKLRHSITFENEPAINQIYYALKLWERFEFNQLNDYLYIAGDADETILTHLQLYIKNVEPINAPSEVFFWSEDAQKAPLDLLALSL